MAKIILDGRREEKLKRLMEEDLSMRSYFGYLDWDGLIENDVFDVNELDYMAEKYKVVVTLVKK